MAGTFDLKVESGGQTLAVRGNEVMDPRGAVIVAPGFAEHAGRYGRLAQELGSRGYSTYVYDPRGHGKSSGPRGHTPSWAQLVDDLDAVIAALAGDASFPGHCALIGMSMGALVALDWALSHRGAVGGLGLVAPFFRPAFKPPVWKVALAQTVGAAIPAFGQPHGLRGRDMSQDRVVAAQYDSDPAITRVMTAR